MRKLLAIFLAVCIIWNWQVPAFASTLPLYQSPIDLMYSYDAYDSQGGIIPYNSPPLGVFECAAFTDPKGGYFDSIIQSMLAFDFDDEPFEVDMSPDNVPVNYVSITATREGPYQDNVVHSMYADTKLPNHIFLQADFFNPLGKRPPFTLKSKGDTGVILSDVILGRQLRLRSVHKGSLRVDFRTLFREKEYQVKCIDMTNLEDEALNSVVAAFLGATIGTADFFRRLLGEPIPGLAFPGVGNP